MAATEGPAPAGAEEPRERAAPRAPHTRTRARLVPMDPRWRCTSGSASSSSAEKMAASPGSAAAPAPQVAAGAGRAGSALPRSPFVYPAPHVSSELEYSLVGGAYASEEEGAAEPLLPGGRGERARAPAERKAGRGECRERRGAQPRGRSGRPKQSQAGSERPRQVSSTRRRAPVGTASACSLHMWRPYSALNRRYSAAGRAWR